MSKQKETPMNLIILSITLRCAGNSNSMLWNSYWSKNSLKFEVILLKLQFQSLRSSFPNAPNDLYSKRLNMQKPYLPFSIVHIHK